MDGIFPALLQSVGNKIIPQLEKLFRASLKTGFIPSIWRGTKVAFIPKPGKESYDDPKPISLMSFILKTLEKLDRRIRGVN